MVAFELFVVVFSTPSPHQLFHSSIKGLFLLKITNFDVKITKKNNLIKNIALLTRFFRDSPIHSPCTINIYLYTPTVKVIVKVRKRSNDMITSVTLHDHSPKLCDRG